MNKEFLHMQKLAGIITEGEYKEKLNENPDGYDINDVPLAIEKEGGIEKFIDKNSSRYLTLQINPGVTQTSKDWERKKLTMGFNFNNGGLAWVDEKNELHCMPPQSHNNNEFIIKAVYNYLKSKGYKSNNGIPVPCGRNLN
jgi:hypothetical protein